MTLEVGKKPIVALMKNMGNNVRIRLKNDLEYHGRLTKCDGYMNLIISDATEYIGKNPAAKYGNVFIRGNNIIFVSFE